jgi:hypothetical protein
VSFPVPLASGDSRRLLSTLRPACRVFQCRGWEVRLASSPPCPPKAGSAAEGA